MINLNMDSGNASEVYVIRIESRDLPSGDPVRTMATKMSTENGSMVLTRAVSRW